MRTYAAMYDAANDQAYVIYKDQASDEWIVFCTVGSRKMAAAIARSMTSNEQKDHSH